MPQILYLEDDHLWAELVEPELSKYGNVKIISTEHEFREAIDELARGKDTPAAVVLEQRVRWTNPAPTMPARPPEVREGGYANAGVRCYQYLRAVQHECSSLPVVFYSVDSRGVMNELLRRGLARLPFDFQIVEKSEGFDELHHALGAIMR